MTSAAYRAEPPVFKVEGEVKGDLARDLEYLEVEETTHGLRTMTARFCNLSEKDGSAAQQLYYLDGAILDFGKKLEVSIGPADDARIIFTGFVSAIEATFDEGQAPGVVAFAEDRLMKLRMTRRSKTYERMSDADIASDIASAHGLAADCDASGPTYDVVQQWNQSDLAFLRDRAALIRAELWVENDKLFFKSRPGRTATELTLVQGNELLSVQIRADLAHQRTSVKVGGYDARARESVDEEATGDAISAEVSAGRTGVDVLRQAFGERPSYRVRDVPLTADEARQWAKNEMLRRARGFVQVTGKARGTPDMIVGSKLQLDRVGAPFSGDGYYVTRVCHTYDQEGFRTRFSAERPTVSTNP